MNVKVAEHLEKALVFLLALSFALPLLLGLCLLIPRVKQRSPAWLRNKTLNGVLIKPPMVKFSPKTLLSDEYQTYIAKDYDIHFIGREVMIRSINELYLRLFHTSPVGELIGPRFSLIEPAYAQEYCLLRGDDSALRAMVADVRRMQDFCDARGTAFALLITPSKAAIYPENLPHGWLSQYKREPRYYDLLLPLLKENGIRYVDGHTIAAEMKKIAVTPVFPLGGIHWGQPAALATTNALLEVLASQKLAVQSIHEYRTVLSDRPVGEDADLVNILNILLPWRYPVATINIRPIASHGDHRPNVVFVGGSFTRKLLEMLDVSQQFSELEYYFYYKISKNCRVDGESHEVSRPTPPINFDTDIFAADALVLELNEQTLHTPASHLVTFLQDALAVLPDPHAPKAPFHYESRMQYAWGKTISFVLGNDAVNAATTKGFSSPTAVGAYTIGPVASLHFSSPSPTEDMVMALDAGAYLVDTRLTEQKVKVRINGHPIADWTWRQQQQTRRSVTIPKQFLSGGDVRLEFQIARPASPAEFGLGTDPRKFGLIVTSIQFHSAAQP